MEETTVTKKPTNEELINQMYDASLAGQKTQLEQTRDQGLAELEQQQQKLQQQTDANLNRTYVEAAKDQRNYAEIQNAYGLSSGAMAQARLAQDNQLEADLTALRGAQAQVDANIERERTMLSQQYMAAIAQAQADNDLQRAQALYEQAKADEEKLRQNQKEAGNLMASVGDYTILANLYGLTPEQLNKLMPTQSGGGTGGTGGGGGGFATWEDYMEYLNGDDSGDGDVDSGDGGGEGEGGKSPNAQFYSDLATLQSKAGQYGLTDTLQLAKAAKDSGVISNTEYTYLANEYLPNYYAKRAENENNRR